MEALSRKDLQNISNENVLKLNKLEEENHLNIIKKEYNLNLNQKNIF
jgi:hypothetical protein